MSALATAESALHARGNAHMNWLPHMGLATDLLSRKTAVDPSTLPPKAHAPGPAIVDRLDVNLLTPQAEHADLPDYIIELKINYRIFLVHELLIFCAPWPCGRMGYKASRGKGERNGRL